MVLTAFISQEFKIYFLGLVLSGASQFGCIPTNHWLSPHFCPWAILHPEVKNRWERPVGQGMERKWKREMGSREPGWGTMGSGQLSLVGCAGKRNPAGHKCLREKKKKQNKNQAPKSCNEQETKILHHLYWPRLRLKFLPSLPARVFSTCTWCAATCRTVCQVISSMKAAKLHSGTGRQSGTEFAPSSLWPEGKIATGSILLKT